MGKTIVEKILNRAGNRTNKSAGDIVNAGVSWLMTNDAVAELTVIAFNKLKRPVWDNKKIAVILDHYVPATTEDAARTHKLLRDFAHKHHLHLFDHQGVCHQLMIENFVAPGDLVIGTDSHTCTYGGLGAFATGVGSTDGAAAMATGEIWLKIPETIKVELSGNLPEQVHPKDIILWVIKELGADGAIYKALEFSGPGALSISNEGRFTICNMAIEAGAKTGIFEPDAVTGRFVKKNRKNKGQYISSDPDASFCRILKVDLSKLSPQIACPWSVDNVVPVKSVEETAIDQAFLGSCTNGRIGDLRIGAKILKDRKVYPGVRFLVTPASQKIYQQAIKEGFIDIFIKAGAIICNPGCSACFGGQGMLWKEEVCIGTHNRNFKSRMGHPQSKVFLASPETVAVSAISGRIQDPTLFF